MRNRRRVQARGQVPAEVMRRLNVNSISQRPQWKVSAFKGGGASLLGGPVWATPWSGGEGWLEYSRSQPAA